MTEYKIPRFLYENLESSLLALSKRYVSELAKHLKVPEKELIKRVMPSSDSIRVLIQDSTHESNYCKAYCQQDKITVFCKKPVITNSEYCLEHRIHRMTILPNKAIQLEKVKDIPTLRPLWKMQSTLLYDDGTIAGKIVDGKIKIFTI